MNKSDYREHCLEAKGEQCTICDATESIIVHHIDGDRENNDLDNLEPVCRSCHNRIHGNHPDYHEWYEKLEGEAGPAFAQAEALQKPIYIREESWNEYDETLVLGVRKELYDMDFRDYDRRELHEATLLVAAEHPELIVEKFLKIRGEL